MPAVTREDLEEWKRKANLFKETSHPNPHYGTIRWYVYHGGRNVILRLNSSNGSRAVLYDGFDADWAIWTYNANMGLIPPSDPKAELAKTGFQDTTY